MLDPHGSARGGEDDAPIALSLHVRNGGASEMKRSIDADGDHAIPYGPIRCFEACENDEARVMYKDIEPAEAGNCKFDDAHGGDGIFQIFVACRGGSARCRDLCDDSVCDRRIEAAAVLRHPRVMDDDGAAASGK